MSSYAFEYTGAYYGDSTQYSKISEFFKNSEIYLFEHRVADDVSSFIKPCKPKKSYPSIH